ncbi:hypothetical protein ACFQ9V_00965 [Leifsonia sp. NPDC056665]|uniref:hypothetical protein n=1 Tax=Leifsonia sp. NPDC056665 TaxID=3345901 RepID=UPI0036948546
MEDLVAHAKRNKYVPDSSKDKPGWGSPLDEGMVVGLAPVLKFTVHDPLILEPEDGLPRRLRLRYYWEATDPRAKRRFGTGANWKDISVLLAADLLLYEERPGVYTGLATAREGTQFRMATNALRALTKSVDDRVLLRVETLAEALSEDFFLWLFYRFQTSANVGSGLLINAMHELSSQDRQFRNAKFSKEATIDRIELAALIALGKASFGPAKTGITSTAPDALFEVELHTDGGFQPFRTTHYENLAVDSGDLGPKMIDDIWVKVLPALRRLHRDDSAWHADGRAKLHELALTQVKTLLDLRAV